jgi:hypothetical protein
VPLWAKLLKALYIGDREMKELEKAQKKYWYDKGFNKWDSGCVANTELCIFAEGWKVALEWALEQETWIGNDDDGEWGIDKDEIEEELNAKT